MSFYSYIKTDFFKKLLLVLRALKKRDMNIRYAEIYAVFNKSILRFIQ